MGVMGRPLATAPIKAEASRWGFFILIVAGLSVTGCNLSDDCLLSNPAAFAREKAMIGGRCLVFDNGHDLESLYRDLRRFSDLVRSIDDAVGSVALRPGDPGSLRAAIAAIDHAIDEQARRPPCHPETWKIAKDLKETRRAALLQRFDKLRLRAGSPGAMINVVLPMAKRC